jgi:hypothetical protein
MTQPIIILADPPAQLSRTAAGLWLAAGMALSPLLAIAITTFATTFATTRPAPTPCPPCPAATAQGV